MGLFEGMNKGRHLGNGWNLGTFGKTVAKKNFTTENLVSEDILKRTSVVERFNLILKSTVQEKIA